MVIYKKHIKYLLLLLYALVSNHLSGQNPIDYPACVSVGPDGTISVNISVDYNAMFKSDDFGVTFSKFFFLFSIEICREVDLLFFAFLFKGERGCFF